MTIFDRIQLGYYLCTALGIIVGIMLTSIAYDRFGETEEANKLSDEEYLFDNWEEGGNR